MTARKLIGGVLATIAIAGAIWGLMPWISETDFAPKCSEPTPRCLIKARAQGHLWSYRGNFERARSWYAWGAERR
jgi:hypothetical protein